MVNVTRTFTVTTPPDRVLDYLKDFSNAEEWDPGTERCTRIGDDAPVAVGAEWHNESKIAGISTELVYALTELTENKVQFRGRNETAETTDTITVVPAPGGGSEITYDAVIEMSGLAKLAAPAVKLMFEKLGNDTEESLTRVLNDL